MTYHWTQFRIKLLNPKKKDTWLKDNNIIEDNLSEEVQYQTEIEKQLAIWHTQREVVDFLKDKQKQGLWPITHPMGTVLIKDAFLTKKEILKDKNGKDHLIFTFQDFTKQFVLFPFYYKVHQRRWDSFNENQLYSITYVEQLSDDEKSLDFPNEVLTLKKHILIWMREVAKK